MENGHTEVFSKIRKQSAENSVIYVHSITGMPVRSTTWYWRGQSLSVVPKFEVMLTIGDILDAQGKPTSVAMQFYAQNSEKEGKHVHEHPCRPYQAHFFAKFLEKERRS